MQHMKKQTAKFIGTGILVCFLLGSLSSCHKQGCPNKITEKPQQEQIDENS